MPRKKPESRQLRIIHVGSISKTSRGNCYLECDTDDGVVAFWGKTGNTLNIGLIREQPSPFGVECGCISSNWSKHVLWVPESSQVSILAQPPGIRHKESATVSLDDLTRLRRVVMRILDQLASRHGQQSGPVSRIWELSRNGVIPREVAAMMRLIIEMRNAAEYEAKLLSGSESEAVKNAWEAVSDWAKSLGLKTME